MSMRTEVALSVGEYHAFEAAGRQFLYMVPSAAVFGLDETSAAVLERLDEKPMAASDLVDQLADRFARKPSTIASTSSCRYAPSARPTLHRSRWPGKCRRRRSR